MSQKQIEIADMQCWVFRHAQRDWDLSPAACTELFRRYNLLGYIADCYELLHVSGYQCALNDIKQILANEGVTV